MAREILENQACELEGISSQFLDDTRTAPPLILCAEKGQDINTLNETSRQFIATAVETLGAVLLRGFKVSSPFAFRKFAASFGSPLADNYDYGSTPRSKVSSGVYNSTDYPAHSTIPMHNEQAYTRQWPSHLWFHCMKASESGGETPLVDSRMIFNDIPKSIRDTFLSKELLYVRNFSPMLDIPWQQVFNTDSKQAVEDFCLGQNIQWQWLDDNTLRTKQKCQSALQHPVTGEWVWFNQAHLFHASALGEESRQGLLSTLGEENLPRNVYYGDGSPIPDEDLDIIREIYNQQKRVFPWQKGDITMIDNLLMAHGRNPYIGERKIIVAMA